MESHVGRKSERGGDCVLSTFPHQYNENWDFYTYMNQKHAHCTPTCATPSKPAKHSKPLICLQHAKSARLAGNVSMFAKPHVPDVVPRRTKYGEMPSEDRRAMIR